MNVEFVWRAARGVRLGRWCFCRAVTGLVFFVALWAGRIRGGSVPWSEWRGGVDGLLCLVGL